MSWEQLRAITKQNKETVQKEQGGKPITCPIDGTILDEGKGGVRNCPLGNYRYPAFGFSTRDY